MNTSSLIAALDAEIAKLQQARALIADADTASPVPLKRRGRPVGSKNAKTLGVSVKKRTMSAEGRARVAAAQKKRWASAKKTAKTSSKS